MRLNLLSQCEYVDNGCSTVTHSAANILSYYLSEPSCSRSIQTKVMLLKIYSGLTLIECLLNLYKCLLCVLLFSVVSSKLADDFLVIGSFTVLPMDHSELSGLDNDFIEN